MEMIAPSFPEALLMLPLQTLQIKHLPCNNKKATFSMETLLTLNQNP